MLPQPDDLRDFVASRHQEMIHHAEQQRLASAAQPTSHRSIPNLKQILVQMIARFEALNTEPVQQPQPSKLATDSGIHRIR
jgi:hypothetical protein